MTRVIGEGGLAIHSMMLENARGCAKEVLAKFTKVVQIWTYATFPDHNNRRCVDYMITIPGVPRDEQVALGNAIAQYHITNRERMGVEYVIWNRRIWRRYANDHGPALTWTPYYGPSTHTDHVHVQYNSLGYEAPKTTAAAQTVTAKTEEEELMALDKKTLDAIAQAVLDSDSVPNEFTANAENKSVTLKTALVYLARDNDKILAQQAEILDRLKALAGPSVPQA